MNQVISNTGFESSCSIKGESYRFSPLWSNGPRLHGGNPIGPSTLLRMVSLSNYFVLASTRGGVYIESFFKNDGTGLEKGRSLRRIEAYQ